MSVVISTTAFDDFMSSTIGEFHDDAVMKPLDHEEIYVRIRRVLSCPEGMDWEALHYFWNVLQIAVHLGRAPPERWQLLAIVRDACSGERNIAPFSNRKAWTEALGHASRLMARAMYRLSTNSRQGIVAGSLLFFEQLGFEVELDGRGARLSSKSFRHICRKIEKHVAAAGGLNTANLLLQGMQGTGRSIDGSLSSARTPAQVYEVSQAGTPFHYIYNVALKHLGSQTRTGNPTAEILKAELHARHLAAALDLEPHSIFENTSLPTRFLEKVLRETVLYDELFSFAQWQPKAGLKIVGMFFNALERVGCDFPRASPSEWRMFTTRLLELAEESQLRQFSAVFFASGSADLARLTPLLELLSIPASRINREYDGPADTNKRMDAAFPLIAMGSNEFLLQPKSIAVRALVDRLLELMRKDEKRKAGKFGAATDLSKLENKFGSALELLTADVLRDIGMTVTHEGAKYHGKSRGHRLEIDIVAEDESHIYLFECKKKVLTNSARQGDSLAVLSDLTESFLKMQGQLARHEAKLRSDGKIVFEDGRSLELNGRQVEKFAISLFDHGALQARGTIIPLFARLFGSRVSTQKPVADAVTAKINKQLAVLAQSVDAICVAQQDQDRQDALHDFAMSTWWMSIDQLHYLCRSGVGVSESLKDLRHLESRTGDIVWDAKRVTLMGPVARAMLDGARTMNKRAML
ncbi:hypothetical protein [Rhizobium jaguaris]|uniref:NERD domain-containing protein n=1 Tax=Rhizobium jaguaris TaxID=1312183 RepID=A0A387G1A2_9HYPH|nr:hypothetical protein [Rhizobium jaguaris]AYG64333.1 hypothetical protein CCGE525_36890 [Rhizobium jaguaris]